MQPAATTFITGSAGSGIALTAAAAALHAAGSGRRTLLLSLGAAPGLAALLGRELGPEPVAVAPLLDALALDPAAELASLWERGRAQLPQLAPIASDELPLLPGLGTLLGLLRLRELAPGYEHIVVDAGPHDALLLALGLPDGLRWLVRLTLGLDRGPGRSPASVQRAILPSGFLPSEVMSGAQEARLAAEQARAELTSPRAGASVFVLRPDEAALAEARLAIPALQLHGMAVAAIAAGPLLPAAAGDGRLAPLVARQEALLSEARAAWPARPFGRLDMPAEGGIAGLGSASLGALADARPAQPPIAGRFGGEPALAIELPGLPSGALGLTLSGDELIVRVGHYRRHILLSEELRGAGGIRATREGELLVVRRRA